MTEETTLRADPSRSMLPVDAFEVELELPAVPEHTHLLSHLGRAIAEQLHAGLLPVRLAVTGASESSYRCELGVVSYRCELGVVAACQRIAVPECVRSSTSVSGA